MDNNTQLKNDGFVIIDVLSVEEINYLNSLCEKYLKSGQSNFIAASHFLAQADSDFINTELHKIIKERMQNLFPDLELLGGTLATKKSGNAILKAHNDWDIVDEKKYNSYNLWLALVDTNTENGTLGLIPNSHLWQHKHRGFGISSNFESFTNKFVQIGIEPNLKAGQAILYNHKLIHYSKPNKTNSPRNVAIIGMKDKAAQLQVSFSLDKENITTYAITQSDFYPFDAEKVSKNCSIINNTKDVNLYSNWNDIKLEYKKNINYIYIHKKISLLQKIKNKLF